MVKREFLLKASLLFSLLLIFSACQSKKADTKQSIKESTVMTTDKSSAKQSTESNVKNSTESSNQTFPTGSLIQAVSDNDSAKVQEILKDKNYTINEVNAQGESPLLIATHQNFIGIAKMLIDAGADINLQDQISDSPYLYAGAQGKTEILTYMLEKQVPDQQKVNRFGGNALIPAAEKGHLENVKLLLKDGRVSIDHQNNYGYTALIEAVALKDGSSIYQQIVKVLLEGGADKTLKDNTGRTAEDYARSLGYSELLNILNYY
ncbi:ankyrin repeat domain-containing protein [Enterococcus ureasiticus]|uniref:ankyrin repeat domain-containing protein n=1 Tax=Enterococcus TaxID=1350 RepID=UPI001A8CAF66|nr:MULTISPECIES: ankyrin repeat domain-containing protein [Enterococcus]MBO0435680.1 ankyrin repeat domain-containing protein [Enterococcus sp. DIV0849a]MBO0474312.1 ankyrin repeat domain-containing protein [Enterococcus ureasiticus]